MKKIIITGVSGFVGDFLYHFFFKNYDVYGIDKVKPDFFLNKKKFFKVNILNKSKIKQIVKNIKPYAIIHAASILFENVSEDKFWNTNYYATLNLLNICGTLKVKKFIFLSTFSVFEKNYKYLIKETEPPTFKTIYGKTKYYTEHALLNHDFHGNIVVLRCPIIIGPKRSERFSILYQLINENIKIPIIGNGENKLSYIHINDLATAIEKSFKLKKNYIFNLCADNPLQFKKIIMRLINKNKSKSSIIFFPKLLGNILFSLIIFFRLFPVFKYQKNLFNYNIVMDNSRIKKILNWKPKYSINAMFEENYKYYLMTSQNFNSQSNSKKNINSYGSKVFKNILKYL